MAEIVSLADAVADLVPDGATVAMEGFTHLIPFAAGHELIRQERKDLTLARLTPDVDLRPDDRHGLRPGPDLLLGRESGVGSLHRLRDAVEHGHPGHWSWRNTVMPAWRPGMWPVPRVSPLASYGIRRLGPLGSHHRRSDLVPVHRRGVGGGAGADADVAVIHAQQADRKGTSACGGSPVSSARRCWPPGRRS